MVNIFWFRRDLRLHDNTGLFHALSEGHPVVPVFIFDEHILSDLRMEEFTVDHRLTFIHRKLSRMNEELKQYGTRLTTYSGRPEEVWREILNEWDVHRVYANRDYEPYAKDRDASVRKLLKERGIQLSDHKDQVIFERDDVLKDDGDPYVVFTPYMRKWKERLENDPIRSYASEEATDAWAPLHWKPIHSLDAMGFRNEPFDFPEGNIGAAFLADYGETRDYPAMDGTSRMGIHLRFGTVSIREVMHRARDAGADTYLNELIWREFYMMILYHFPQVVDKAFKPKYDRIPWRDHEEDFERWCRGETGYPLVDAGMRQLRETGYMHNRVRMVTASFLTKHLLIDWRKGEAWFARWLLDYELASNNGGWQWAAGTGCDAAPYFRIFNPVSQMKKFDPQEEYVKQWLPEYGTEEYPDPIVEHKSARQRALDTYKGALE